MISITEEFLLALYLDKRQVWINTLTATYTDMTVGVISIDLNGFLPPRHIFFHEGIAYAMVVVLPSGKIQTSFDNWVRLFIVDGEKTLTKSHYKVLQYISGERVVVE